MKGRTITAKAINEFREHLILEEKSKITIEKYIRDIKAFAAYTQGNAVAKETVIAYKKCLQETYAVRSVNSMLASINSLFTFLGWHELRVRSLKLQQQVFCPEEKELKQKLLRYATAQGINTGMIFVTRTGKPVSRTNIWREMKALCKEANVDPQKVFPHNLRHLFARVFYGLEKDIAKLADILGHSSINTTRIYIISTGAEHRRHMENMRLIL